MLASWSVSEAATWVCRFWKCCWVSWNWVWTRVHSLRVLARVAWWDARFWWQRSCCVWKAAVWVCWKDSNWRSLESCELDWCWRLETAWCRYDLFSCKLIRPMIWSVRHIRCSGSNATLWVSLLWHSKLLKEGVFSIKAVRGLSILRSLIC